MPPLLVLALSELSAGLSLLLALLLLNKRSAAHPPVHCGTLSLVLLCGCSTMWSDDFGSVSRLCMALLWCMPCQAPDLGNKGPHEVETAAAAEQQPAGSNELFTLLPMYVTALNRA
jgi:hypothetical protein